MRAGFRDLSEQRAEIPTTDLRGLLGRESRLQHFLRDGREEPACFALPDRILRLRRDADDPGQAKLNALPETLANLGGNHVVLDLGDGTYAIRPAERETICSIRIVALVKIVKSAYKVCRYYADKRPGRASALGKTPSG